jgi:hypothetical protein
VKALIIFGLPRLGFVTMWIQSSKRRAQLLKVTSVLVTFTVVGKCSGLIRMLPSQQHKYMSIGTVVAATPLYLGHTLYIAKYMNPLAPVDGGIELKKPGLRLRHAFLR